ncbi:hypothetical protein N185_16160 [Sinorhizobium sp. GW3]|nr:hypothetical protein N185_16160 [Sinorhizobium sp. GW3]
MTREMETEVEKALQDNALTKAAAIIQEGLKAPDGEYAAWLWHEFDDADWKIFDLQLITEILDLPCPLLATTNYDRLLQRYDASMRMTCVQTQPASMVDVLRRGGVFHLHGIYTEPGSVILSDGDYTRALNDPAYRSVIQALWMTKSLLFIGCSFDGITDPDFTRLFEWAAKTFGSTPYRHYVLMPDDAASVKNNRRYLLGDTRLQIIPFGETYNELSRFIAELNPSRAEARRRRAIRVGELLASSDVVDFPGYSDALGPWLPPAKVAEFEAEARAAQLQRIGHVERSRATLKVAKAILENIAEKEAILELGSNWESISNYSDSIHKICLAAFTGISTVSPAFLRELNKSDHVSIAGSVLEGGSQLQMQTLEGLHKAEDRARIMRSDSYARELVGRILRTYAILLKLDADILYPLPSDTFKTNLRGTFIAIGSSAGVTILDAGDRSSVAFLQTDNRVRDLKEIDYKGAKALLILVSDRWLIWDPRRAGLPLMDVQVSAGGIATHIVSYPTTEPASIWIKASRDQLLHFKDGRHTATTIFTADLSSFATVGGQIYGSVEHGEIFRISTDGTIAKIVERNQVAEQLVQLLNKHPFVAKSSKDEIIELIKLRIHHTFLQSVRIEGQEVLAICVRCDLARDGNTLVLLWRRDEGFVGHWLFEGRVAALNVSTDSMGPLLVATLLSHARPDEPLMLWARPANDDKPLHFETIRSGVCVQQDLLCLSPVNKTTWFVGDMCGQSYIVENDAETRNDGPIPDDAELSIVLKW